MLPPLSRRGICVSIRKFPEVTFTLEKLIAAGSLSEQAAEFLGIAVRLRKNITISGGTGTGKTSLLNALSGCIPAHERIIVIEDSTELKLPPAAHTLPRGAAGQAGGPRCGDDPRPVRP